MGKIKCPNIGKPIKPDWLAFLEVVDGGQDIILGIKGSFDPSNHHFP